jgi:hypothetical protein
MNNPFLQQIDNPTSYRILFDANVSHYLSTDACAVIGGELTRRLLKRYAQIRSVEMV